MSVDSCVVIPVTVAVVTVNSVTSPKPAGYLTLSESKVNVKPVPPDAGKTNTVTVSPTTTLVVLSDVIVNPRTSFAEPVSTLVT